jgi:hypothetical protein
MPAPADRRTRRLLLPGAVVVGLLLWGAVRPLHLQVPTTFASRIAQLSERGGDFDFDNLISNEKSYLHVIPALRDGHVTGGAYIGVGPDQNFSYVAQIRPSIAFVIDIRRDNMLLHLLFKALFSLSTTRVDYMSLLFGRPVPATLDSWRKADVNKLAAYIDDTQPTAAATAALRARVNAVIRTFGVTVSAADMATIDRFHRKFIADGLSLKFDSPAPAPRGYYPTYRELLFETDHDKHQWNFLASEDDFQFVRSLERRDLVIPVVGDLGGPTAINAISRLLTARRERVSAFYVSNVEFYLSGDGKFQEFLNNVSRLPHTDQSVIIRSVFGGYRLPESVPGYFSTSFVQPIDQLLAGFSSGRYKTYNDLLLLTR